MGGLELVVLLLFDWKKVGDAVSKSKFWITANPEDHVTERKFSQVVALRVNFIDHWILKVVLIHS